MGSGEVASPSEEMISGGFTIRSVAPCRNGSPSEVKPTDNELSQLLRCEMELAVDPLGMLACPLRIF